MKFNPQKHHRRSIRLKGYDYTQAGAYFVTICTYNRECLFGDVADGKMILNAFGKIAESEWLRAPEIRSYVELDEYSVMPNHVHGIIIIHENVVGARRRLAQNGNIMTDNGARRRLAPTENGIVDVRATRRVAHDGKIIPNNGATHRVAPAGKPHGPKPGSVGAIVGQFKSITEKQINRLRGTPGASVWQRNYHEHVIRNETELNRIREYIRHNPLKWAEDRENPILNCRGEAPPRPYG